MFEWLVRPDAWIALGTLTALEIVLGIDNIIFLSVLVGRLPETQRDLGEKIGLGFAMIARLALLFSISWVMGLHRTVADTVRQADFRARSHSDRGRDVPAGQSDA